MSDEKTREPEQTEDTEGHRYQTGPLPGAAKDTFAKDTFAKEGFAKEGYANAQPGDDDTEGHSVTTSPEDYANFAKEGFAKEGFAKEGFAKEGFAKEGFAKEGFAKEQ